MSWGTLAWRERFLHRHQCLPKRKSHQKHLELNRRWNRRQKRTKVSQTFLRNISSCLKLVLIKGLFIFRSICCFCIWIVEKYWCIWWRTPDSQTGGKEKYWHFHNESNNSEWIAEHFWEPSWVQSKTCIEGKNSCLFLYIWTFYKRKLDVSSRLFLSSLNGVQWTK